MNFKEGKDRGYKEENLEVYPPKTLYKWKNPEELKSSALEKLQVHYAQFPQVALKEVLLLNGHPEEITLTAFVLNFAHYLLMHETSDFPSLEGIVRETYPEYQKLHQTTVSPCNFEIGKLSEYKEQMLFFSKLRTAPDEMYEEARDRILSGANQFLLSMNRNLIPSIGKKY